MLGRAALAQDSAGALTAAPTLMAQQSKTSNTEQFGRPTQDARVFNDDLLTNPGDLQHARQQFPAIVHVLDHSALRARFIEYDRIANTARSRLHFLGVVAVVASAVALLSTATEPLWRAARHADTFSLLFEIVGLGAALVAGGSLYLGPWRQRWLESRFMTERLRQWHFQLLVRKGTQIEASVAASSDQAKQVFRVQRDKWLADFLYEYEGRIASRMEAVMGDPGLLHIWLHSEATPFTRDGACFQAVFEAYRRLRLDHQYDYATHKLSEARDLALWQFLRWPLVRQEAAVRKGVTVCFAASMLCGICVILNGYFHIIPAAAPYLASATLASAVLGVALRAVQDGLGMTKDIERYRDFCARVRRLLIRVEAADYDTRLRVMEEMETIAVDELRGFLRAHRDAAFGS